MDIGGMSNKLLGAFDTNSTAIGGGIAALKLIMPRGGGESMLSEDIQRLLGGTVHGPDFAKIMNEIKTDPSYMTAIMGVVGGYIAQQTNVKLLDRIGSIAVKASTAYLAVRLAELVLFACTHSPGRGESSGGASAPTSGYGY